jgi:hypothetical protein
LTPTPRPSAEAIIAAGCAILDVPPRVLAGRSRAVRVVHARRLIVFALRVIRDDGWTTIGAAIGHDHHTLAMGLWREAWADLGRNTIYTDRERPLRELLPTFIEVLWWVALAWSQPEGQPVPTPERMAAWREEERVRRLVARVKNAAKKERIERAKAARAAERAARRELAEVQLRRALAK